MCDAEKPVFKRLSDIISKNETPFFHAFYNSCPYSHWILSVV